MTAQTIASIERQSLPTTLLAIDNGSTDGCGPYLRSIREGIILQSYQQPRSLHHVWNAALRFAFGQMELPYALVVNNDLVLRPDTFRLLVEDGGGFVTGVSVDKPEDTYMSDPASKSPHPCFSCFLIRKEVWDVVGVFDEELWAWAGDADYHLRMDALGIDACSIAVPFLHIGSGTLKNADPVQHEHLCKLSDADRTYFEKKWGVSVGSPAYYEMFRKPRENIYATTGRLA